MESCEIVGPFHDDYRPVAQCGKQVAMPVFEDSRFLFGFWLLPGECKSHSIGIFAHSQHFLRLEHLSYGRKTRRDPKLPCRIADGGGQMDRRS